LADSVGFNALEVPVKDRQVSKIAKLLKSDSEQLQVAACGALIGTESEDDAAEVAKKLANTSRSMKLWYWEWLKKAGREVPRDKDVLAMFSSLNEPDLDVDQRGNIASRLALIGIGTPMQEKILRAYFQWVDHAEVYKEWHNPSYVLGSIVAIAEALYPGDVRYWERSLGARYVRPYGSLTIGKWVVSSKDLPNNAN